MQITKDVIIDLLPLFYSKECSNDTKLLVEEYLRANPDFERQVKPPLHNELPGSVPDRLDERNEMKALAKTKRLLRLRSFLMGLAIFFSVAPFSFVQTNEGKTYWLFSYSPSGCFMSAILGIGLWVAYFVTRKKTADL
jgi:hypothetical protein